MNECSLRVPLPLSCPLNPGLISTSTHIHTFHRDPTHVNDRGLRYLSRTCQGDTTTHAGTEQHLHHLSLQAAQAKR